MIVRLIMYHSDKPVEEMDQWIVENRETMRAVPGVTRVEFCRMPEDPQHVAAMMYFEDMAAMTAYKETGAYQDLIKTLRLLLDETKPPKEIIMTVLDF